MSAGKKRRVQLLTLPEAGARLGCSRTHVYRLIANGDLSSVDVAGKGTRTKTRVLEHELEAYIERQTTKVGAA